jgi:hypothetical protein
MKNSNAPAVKREAEEESGKKRGENHDLGARGPFCLTLQKRFHVVDFCPRMLEQSNKSTSRLASLTLEVPAAASLPMSPGVIEVEFTTGARLRI